MNAKETKLVQELVDISKDLKESYKNFSSKIDSQVSKIESKVDSKHIPITLEDEILKASKNAIMESMVKTLVGYNSPLQKLVERVIERNSKVLEDIIQDSFTQVINTEDFKEGVKQAFTHKVAKNLVSSCDSLFDKATNDLKQNPQFKAKLVVTVASIVDEFSKGN